MGVQVPELKQCVQSFHFIVLSSSLSSLLVLCFYLGKFFFSLSSAPSKVRLGFAMTISLPRFSLLFLAPNETPSDEAKRSSHHHHHHHHLLNNRYMDKKLKLKLNGNRGVIGILRGFDQFLNLVLDECVNDSTAEKTPLGMVVVRGASVLSMEALEHIAPVQRKSVM